MTILAAVLVAALVASNYLWLRELRKQRDAAWTREQNLLNRVQHPEVFQPVAAEVEEREPEPEGTPDEYDLVGTIRTNSDG